MRVVVNQFTTETGVRGEYSPHLHNCAMGQIRSRRLDTWDCCSRELVARQSRFRLRRYPRSPFVYVRELVQGRQVRDFSLSPMEHRNDADVERARDLCLEGHRAGQWPAHSLGRSAA